MKILFITTFGQSIPHEHVFTRNVWLELFKKTGTYLMTFFKGKNNSDGGIEYDETERWYKLTIPSYIFQSYEETKKYVAKYINQISPNIIHSNMIEGFDVEVAKKLNIPIVLTMHISGLICPRGGGNGFLKWNDTICNGIIGNNCQKCCCYDLPLPKLATVINNILPHKLNEYLVKKLKNHQIFYITPLLSINNHITKKLQIIEVLKNATVITANTRLSEILSHYDIQTKIIPHGIRHFDRLPYPGINNTTKVKFYFLGRIQYSKGLHILLEAFKGIPHDQYELHIFGDAYLARKQQRYKRKVLLLAKDVNIIFHGFVENEDLNIHLRNMHVMIHPAICLEVYGLTISEALSIGHPVLATRCGGSEMQIIEGRNGWLVDPANPSALHRQIQYIIKHKHILKNISKNCSCPNTLENYINQLISLYSSLVRTSAN